MSRPGGQSAGCGVAVLSAAGAGFPVLSPSPSFLPCFPHLVDPGYSNAKSEGINRVIKLVARERSASATSFPSSFMGVRHFPSRRRDAAPWYSTSLSERPVRALSGAAVPDLCSCSALPHRGRIGEHRLHLSGGRPVA